MLARKCDRCGAFYEHYEGAKKFKDTDKANGFLFIDLDLNEKYYARRRCDLCEACMTKLKIWLKEMTEADNAWKID